MVVKLEHVSILNLIVFQIKIKTALMTQVRFLSLYQLPNNKTETFHTHLYIYIWTGTMICELHHHKHNKQTKNFYHCTNRY